MKGLNKIERKRSGYSDSSPYLNNTELKEGQAIMCKFPDDTFMLIKVSILSEEGHSQDMSARIPYTRKDAYWKTLVHGMEVDVPLIGLEAKRIIT